jgi:5-methylcytosine-specific restriction endonuclease McrBC regulatory subunit McrC
MDSSTRIEISEFYKNLSSVSNLHSNICGIFEHIIYTPLNDHYRKILSLCELILRDSSLDIENSGRKNSLEFLVNMNTLFQEFVARVLTGEFGEINIELQRARYFDKDGELTEISDIQLYSGESSIILDTKYKHIGERVPPAEDVRQVFCYSRITNSKKCVLIYATKEHVTTKQYNLPDGVCLSQLHFNLSGSSKDEFDGNCSDFVNEINRILKC